MAGGAAGIAGPSHSERDYFTAFHLSRKQFTRPCNGLPVLLACLPQTPRHKGGMPTYLRASQSAELSIQRHREHGERYSCKGWQELWLLSSLLTHRFYLRPYSVTSVLLIPRFFVMREDFVPRASRPCSSMAGTAMARLWLRLCRSVPLW